MARKPKSKAPSVEQEQAAAELLAKLAASEADSDAPAPAPSPQAAHEQTAALQGCDVLLLDAPGLDSDAPIDPAQDQPAAAETAQHATPHETGNVPQPSIALDSLGPTAARACVRDRLQNTEEWPKII